MTTLYHTPDRKRWFLVPSEEPLAEGGLRVRRFAGPEQGVADGITAHEVDEAAARAWLDERFSATFAKAGEVFGRVLTQLRSRGTAVPEAVAAARFDPVELLGATPGELYTDPERAQRAAARLLGWLKPDRPLPQDREQTVRAAKEALRSVAGRRGARAPRELRRVGFFAELRHGDPRGERLADLRRPDPQPDEDALVDYLRQAPVLVAAVGPVRDVLDPSQGYIGAPSIQTDGTWAWPADLAHYVARYHVHLPEAFVGHARSLGFRQVPFDVVSVRF